METARILYEFADEWMDRESRRKFSHGIKRNTVKKKLKRRSELGPLFKARMLAPVEV